MAVDKNCEFCGKAFTAKYSLNQRFCSRVCGNSRSHTQFKCAVCSTPFTSYKKAAKYCGRGCFHKSQTGAPKVSGWFPPNKDKNHDEIVSTLKGLGLLVSEHHDEGNGFPDLIVGIEGIAPVVLAEVKNPANSYGRRGLNKAQRRFAERLGVVRVIQTVDDCVDLAKTLRTWQEAVSK
jgi:hypothetical protein